MTLPNMPWDSTDPEDLPQGAAYPGSSLGNLLQNPSVSKFANLGGGRFPGVFFSQPAGSPLNPSMPLGFITDLFAKFASYVAQADPATINKPEDLQGLITDFVVGLPLSSLGSASNPLEQIQFSLDGVFTDLDNIFDYYSGLLTTTTRIQNGINQGWIDGDESEADADIFATMRSVRVAASGASFTRVVCTSSTTWNPPVDVELKEVVVLAVAAGTNGSNGGTHSGNNGGIGGTAGSGGGFVCKAVSPDDFDALHVTLGTNGTASTVRADDGSGDILVQALNGAPSATATVWGWAQSSSGAGDGGAGGKGAGSASGQATAGANGQATPAIPGGTGGIRGEYANGASPINGGQGSDGGSVLSTNPVPCGGSGAGGGGGGGINATLSIPGNGGHGGAGGFPGGGGGGGGGKPAITGGNSPGNGGVGASGLVLIYYR